MFRTTTDHRGRSKLLSIKIGFVAHGICIKLISRFIEHRSVTTTTMATTARTGQCILQHSPFYTAVSAYIVYCKHVRSAENFGRLLCQGVGGNRLLRRYVRAVRRIVIGKRSQLRAVVRPQTIRQMFAGFHLVVSIHERIDRDVFYDIYN